MDERKAAILNTMSTLLKEDGVKADGAMQYEQPDKGIMDEAIDAKIGKVLTNFLAHEKVRGCLWIVQRVCFLLGCILGRSSVKKGNSELKKIGPIILPMLLTVVDGLDGLIEWSSDERACVREVLRLFVFSMKLPDGMKAFVQSETKLLDLLLRVIKRGCIGSHLTIKNDALNIIQLIGTQSCLSNADGVFRAMSAILAFDNDNVGVMKEQKMCFLFLEELLKKNETCEKFVASQLALNIIAVIARSVETNYINFAAIKLRKFINAKTVIQIRQCSSLKLFFRSNKENVVVQETYHMYVDTLEEALAFALAS